MATSSIGTTTVVKGKYGSVLLEAIRRRKELARSRAEEERIRDISEMRAVGMRR